MLTLQIDQRRGNSVIALHQDNKQGRKQDVLQLHYLKRNFTCSFLFMKQVIYGYSYISVFECVLVIL